MFQLEDGRKQFYQWDIDRKLIVEDETIKEVHFCNRTDNCSLVCKPYLENGQYLVDVPNILLQTAWKIRVYAYIGYTKHEECFEVIARTKPADYIYTETEVLTWEVYEKKLEDKPGVKTEAGEIFNNYSNNKAGIKGYYYSNIDFKNKVITLSKTQEYGIEPEAFDVMYQIGDSISLINGYRYTNFTTIKAINKNKITVESLPFNTVTNEYATKEDDYGFYVVNKPDVGVKVFGYYSHAEGEHTHAVERASHAEGYGTKALGQYSHAEGLQTSAVYAAHAEGQAAEALGNASHAEGYNTRATESSAHAEGRETYATNVCAHAEGYGTTASGLYSHAEGNGAKATNNSAHAEGQTTQANGQYGAHAEGFSSQANGVASHAENRATKANADYSHAEGQNSQANGIASHAEGYNTQTTYNGNYSHAEGIGTVANAEGQHAQGKYNINDYNGEFAHIVGNGTNDKRSNAHTIDWNGNGWFAGSVEATAIILKAPNGTRYKITVDNSGNLTTVKA